jgi:hypothetical protein
MSSTTGEGDDKVVAFPKTAEERRALAKAKQDREKQKLIHQFVDEETGQGLFHTPEGVGYADLVVEGCRQTWPVRSKQFRFAYCRYIQRGIERLVNEDSAIAALLKASLNKRRVNETIDDFEMKAMTSDTERKVYLRVASHSGDLYVDLCDRDWHAIRVTGANWQIVQSPPVRFRRTHGMLPLPFPERGTSVGTLRPFLNVKDENDFTLVVAFILAALRDRGPYPVLGLIGEQGTAKSTFARILRSLIDPSSVPLTTLPPSSRDLFIAANNAHLLSFENISKLSNRLSDDLCRLATGGGYRIRKLYENADEALFDATRPIVLNGITNFIVRGDLQDRSIVLPLPPITSRITESELYADFERQRAGIFGALLDLLVHGARMLPETRLADAPRMADFATWAVACGLNTFEAAYAANRANAIAVMLEHDVLAQALRATVQDEWVGTASQLLDVLGPATKIANAKALSEELARLAPMLRTVGIDVTQGERTNERRIVRIRRR